MRLSRFVISLLLSLGLSSAIAETATPASAGSAAPVPAALPVSTFEPVPANKDNDLRLFYPDGKILKGSEALEKMGRDASLTMWLAGNQFFAMEDVVRAFYKKNRGVGSVGIITLPPGVILNAINKGGWSYEGKDYPMTPDIYASVNLDHLKALKAKGKMDHYMIYIRNKLELVVAQGNPKHVKDIDDLKRTDLRIMLPNPITEGIMKFYVKKVLVQHGLWDQLSGGKECKSCQATPQTYFTAVHHREIPDALKAGTTDVGIVWASEVQHAKDEGATVEGVPLPPEDSLVKEVAYVIGSLEHTKHAAAAKRYLNFLKSPQAQKAYTHHGFINATKEDLNLNPIP